MHAQPLLPALVPIAGSGARPISSLREASESNNPDDRDVLYATSTPEREATRATERHKPKISKHEEEPDSKDGEITRTHGYSSFTFPPNRHDPKSVPHRLGDRKPEDELRLDKPAFTQEHREHQHHRDKLTKGIGALVRMHRDRDREQARQSEREHRTERKLDPEADKVKAGNGDEIDVVLELEKDWEKSQKVRLLLVCEEHR